MGNNKTHIEKTAAETKSIGFDYQYYFFLWKLLSLEMGESVGLEVKDDVHTELNNNTQVLYQVKHTTQLNSDGTTANLTTSDTDLWKTLSNWAQVISDSNDNRTQKNEQLSFIKKTSFILASNKSSSADNKIMKSIMDYQGDPNTIAQTMEVFDNLFKTSTDNKLKGYIQHVLTLESDVLKEFMLKIFFELDENDIIGKCKDAIKSDKIDEKKLDLVYSGLDSAIRTDNFINIKQGKKIQITFEDFYSKYRRHYDLARNDSLSINAFDSSLPEELELQIFIKQLVEIGDLENSDFENIAEFTRFKLKLQNNIESWLQDGVITQDEVNRFNNEAINQWKNVHRRSFRGIVDEQDFNRIGLEVLDSIRDRQLHITDQPLDTDMCNGTFYELSNVPEIGWRKDWEKYKK